MLTNKNTDYVVKISNKYIVWKNKNKLCNVKLNLM